jgi:hypothetical protein
LLRAVRSIHSCRRCVYALCWSGVGPSCAVRSALCSFGLGRGSLNRGGPTFCFAAAQARLFRIVRGLGCSDGCGASPAYVFVRIVLEASGGCAAPPTYVRLRFGHGYLAALERPVSCQMSENLLPPPLNHLTHALDQLRTLKSGKWSSSCLLFLFFAWEPPLMQLNFLPGDSHTTMSTGLPLVHWSGRTITPAYQRLVLGPIWLALVDPLDCTGIGVAGVGTCLDSTQPALASLLLCIPPGISTGRISVFPSVPQRSTSYCMTVVRTAKAPYKPAPYPYQSTISRAYRRRNRTSLVMNPPSAAYPAVV